MCWVVQSPSRSCIRRLAPLSRLVGNKGDDQCASIIYEAITQQLQANAGGLDKESERERVSDGECATGLFYCAIRPMKIKCSVYTSALIFAVTHTHSRQASP